jgi:hypothetical protein
MATSKVTPAVSSQDVAVSNIPVRGTLGVAAGDYPANGLPVSFVGFVQANPVPSKNSVLVSGLSGYEYAFDDVHQTLRAYLGGTEVTTTTPGSVVSDTISFQALFPKV